MRLSVVCIGGKNITYFNSGDESLGVFFIPLSYEIKSVNNNQIINGSEVRIVRKHL